MSEFKLEVPVVFIIFNRLDTVQRVFEKIKAAKPAKFYIISDGAREGVTGEADKVAQVRDYVDSHIDWECEVVRDYADHNIGCKMRIVTGLNNVFAKEEYAIIVEDDILPHDTFFPFCQEMLLRYREDDRIGMVSGCNMCTEYQTSQQYMFTKIPETWGWATWKRVWETYDENIPDWESVKASKYLQKHFGKWHGNEIMRGLDMVVKHGLEAWDYQWVYNIATHGYVGIMPTKNLVLNIGFDREDATHTKGKCVFDFAEGEVEFPIQPRTDYMLEYDFDQAYVDKYMKENPIERLYTIVMGWIQIHILHYK